MQDAPTQIMGNNSRLARLLLLTMVGLLTAFGLFAIRYTSHGRHRFAFSKAYLVYCLAVSITFASIYTRQIYEDYMQSQLNLRDAVKLYGYMNIAVAIINYVTQLLTAQQVAQQMNQIPVFKMLNDFDIDRRAMLRSVATAMLKALGFPLLIELALVLEQHQKEPQFSSLWTLYKLFPMIIANLLNNCHFGAIVICKVILEALNKCVESQVEQVNSMQREDQLKLNSSYYRTQRFCALADELDKLAFKYHIVCTKALDYMALMELSMLLSLLCHLLGITVGCFTQYSAMADTFINGQPYDAFGALTSFIFLAISSAEIVLLAHLSSEALAATRRTGVILQRMTLRNADWRYKQAVDAFSLRIAGFEFKIVPLGLFELNISIVTDMLATVCSFLLILIQSDLSQRLK